MAEGGHDEGLRMGSDDRAAVHAPLPADQGEGLDAHVLEAQPLQVIGGPGGGGLLRVRARGARSETRRDLGHIIERHIVLQHLIAQRDGRGHGRGVLGGGRQAETGGRSEGEGADDQGTNGHGHGSRRMTKLGLKGLARRASALTSGSDERRRQSAGRLYSRS